MKPQTDKLQEVFNQALEYANARERAEYLRQACGNDQQLLKQVQELVEVHQTSGEFLQADPRDQGMSLLATADVAPSESPGTVIGRYKLLEQIGEGGFGVVFMAEQEEPVRRKVALKIIKLGMDTKQVIARFEAERQALAMMDHPNIAKVLDAGAAETGRPYFVMELVRGIPITQFCEENQLTIKERLQLFIPVCQAIQHAHQKGVIHRDIKPSNVLVTMNEGVPHPMVIDFGVAKAIDQRLTEKTLYTRFAQMIGTPAYMSPEQAEMSKQDVDTRTDVYSLGMLLYELLTGTTPFPEERLREAGYAEIQRIISQEEPVRPSTLLGRLNGRSHKVAASRRCEPASLLKLIKGDLDWIVLKAIDKDRNRRYETTNGLAADIHRYLSDEPVLATPPSKFYRFRKFVHRNRVTVVAGIAVGASLILGTVVSVTLAIRAEKQKAALAAYNQWVTEHLVSFGFTAEHGEGIGVNTTYLDVLSHAARSIDDGFANEPEVEAILRYRLGNSLAYLDRIGEALPHLRRAYELAQRHFGDTDSRTLEIQYALAENLTWFYGFINLGAAEDALEEEGMRLLRQGRNRCEQYLGPGHPLTLRYQIRLAFHLNRRGDGRQAETLLKSTAARIDTLPRDGGYERDRRALNRITRQQLLDDWRMIYSVAARTAVESRRIYLDLLGELRQRRLTSDHPGDYSLLELEVMMNMGGRIRHWEREPLRALELFSEGLIESRKLVGESYPTTAFLSSLAATYLNLGDFSQALAFQRESLAALETTEVPRSAIQDKIIWIASTPARLGDWRAAADELESQRTRGYVDSKSMAFEGLLRVMEGNSEEWQKLKVILAERLEEPDLTDADFAVTEVLLVLSALESEMVGLGPLIERRLDETRNDLERAHINALSAFRNRRWQDVAEASPAVLNSRGPWRMRAALMGYLSAVSHHHLGNATEALRLINTSDVILDGFLQAGDLTVQWQVPALCLLTRNRAHAVVPGEGEDFSVDSEWLESRRTTWKPVKDQLEQANERARRQDYQEAARMYREVLSDPQFHDSLAAFSDLDIRKMALAFALADAREDYVRVCQRVYAGVEISGWHVDLWPLSFLPEVLPEELKADLKLWHSTQESIRHVAEEEPPVYDQLLQIGLVCSQLGRYADACLALEVAKRDWWNHTETWQVFSLLAKALHAKSRLQLGDTEAAAREFLEVQKESTRLLELGEGRMNPDWTAQAILHSVLAETEPLIRSTGDDSSASAYSARIGISAHSDSSTEPGGVESHVP